MPKTLKRGRSKAKSSTKTAKRSRTAAARDANERDKAPDDADELLDLARSSVDLGLRTLHERIEVLAKNIREEDEYSREDVSHLAWVTKMVASVMGEIRKSDERELRFAAKLSPQLVMAHLRALPIERRGHVIRELTEMDANESVLSS